jgi:hypothetical protein
MHNRRQLGYSLLQFMIFPDGAANVPRKGKTGFYFDLILTQLETAYSYSVRRELQTEERSTRMKLKSSPHIRRLLVPLLILAGSAGIVFAQPEMPAFDPLAGLKNALQNAGASALTSDQESSINALLQAYRSTHGKPSPNAVVQAARTAYENAILNGDSAAAASQAAILGNAQASEMAQRETDAAALAISVENVLKTESGQTAALISRMGSSAFVRLLLSLGGGPRGFGPRPGGPPPDGGGPAGPPPEF